VGSGGFLFLSGSMSRQDDSQHFSKRNSSPALRNFGVKPDSPLGQNKRAAGCGQIARIVSAGIS
jgi:hypothetical protein